MEILIVLIFSFLGLLFSYLAGESYKEFYLFSPIILTAIYLSLPFTLKFLNIIIAWLLSLLAPVIWDYYLNGLHSFSFVLFFHQSIYLFILAIILFLLHSKHVQAKL